MKRIHLAVAATLAVTAVLVATPRLAVSAAPGGLDGLGGPTGSTSRG